MRIVVCVKQVYDPQTVKLSRSREELDLREAVLMTNPADKVAVEVALRLRDSAPAGSAGAVPAGADVIALTVGGPEADDVVREAIALGADRGVRVEAPADTHGAAVTRLLAAAVNRIGGVELVLTGAEGGFDGTGGTPPRLAAALGWPILLNVIRFISDEKGLSAVVLHGAGAELSPVTMPAVLAVTADAGRPRYPHPARIANAWAEGLVETWPADALGVALVPDVERGGLILGPERVRGQVIRGAPEQAAGELLAILRTKRLV